jgi:hypothetical protein
MNTPSLARAAAGFAFGAAVWFSVPAGAASAPPPSISLDVKSSSVASKASGKTSKKSGSVSNAVSGNTSHSVTYDITIHNNGSQPVSGLTLNYEIYTKHAQTDKKGNNSSKISTTSDSASTDVPANDSADVTTKAVTTEFKETFDKNGVQTSITKIDLVGIWIEAKLGDTVLTTLEDPEGIKQKVADSKKSSGDGSDDRSSSSDSSSSADSN